MRPTRTRMLLLSVVLVAAVTWALLHAIYASLPPLTWTGVPALLVVAAVEAWLGWDLRARISGAGSGGGGRDGTRPAAPLFVARAVVLAKATSQTAALLAGISVGFMVYLSNMTGSPTPRSDLVNASLSFGACLVLMAAGLYLEYSCRVPPEDGSSDAAPPPPRESPFHHGLWRAMAKTAVPPRRWQKPLCRRADGENRCPAAPMAKTAILSARRDSDISRGDAPPYPPMSAFGGRRTPVPMAKIAAPGGRPSVPPEARRCAPHRSPAAVADSVVAILVSRWQH